MNKPFFAKNPSILIFLAGLVIHGGVQGWWIAPVLGGLKEIPLMLAATGLTAFNDNAAITYLSTLVPGFSSRADLTASTTCAGAWRSRRTAADWRTKPHDHRATRIPPTIPISGSIHVKPKNLAHSSATMASSEVRASASTWR